MRAEQLFPFLLIILDFAASVPYWLMGDWRMGLYWVFAAGLTAVVTF